MLKKLIQITCVIFVIYVVGTFVGSLILTHPIMVLSIIGICFIVSIFGLIKLPFDLLRIFKVLKNKYD